MKTKEQILETALDSHHVSGLVEESGRIWRAILEAMEEYKSQPSGEGVKSPESYLQGMESVYSPTSIGANYSESDVIKALTAQARDYEREMEAVGEYVIKRKVEEYNLGLEYAGTNKFVMHASVPELLNDFRNDRSKPKDHEKDND